MKLHKNKYFQLAVILSVGILIGRFVLPGSSNSEHAHETNETAAKTEWTCSMHPQIRMDKFGLCPLCAMDLIPATTGGTADINAISMTPEAIQLANIATVTVSKGLTEKETRLFGKVALDERLTQTLSAHIPGRIEKLYINFTGETVKAGQLLAKVYSPEMIIAQTELLEALKMKPVQTVLIESAREKLRQWKLTEKQISEIETSGKVRTEFEVYASQSGIVMEKIVNSGDYVQSGSALFRIADLSRVWVLFDAYESDMPFLKTGNTVKFWVEALQNKEFEGTVVFIDPVVDALTRVAKLRVEVENSNGLLKPEMFAKGVVKSSISGNSTAITVPQSAVLWTGKRSVVYVKLTDTEEPTFRLREVSLGALTNLGYIIEEGLAEGEEIVVNGTFSVDAAAQLAGKESMMSYIKKPENKLDRYEFAVKKADISNEFTKQYVAYFSSYLKLKDAFVSSDQKAVKKAAEPALTSLKVVDIKQTKGKAHEAWFLYSEDIKSALQSISKANSIEKQREAFSKLNDVMYFAVKNFNPKGSKVYYQFCSMAFNDTGGYWFSDEEKIMNPYFGDEMLHCGEVKEVFEK